MTVSRLQQLKSLLEVASTGVVLVVAIAVGWKVFVDGQFGGRRGAASATTRPLPSEPISLQGAEMLGSEAARIVILQFSEFECPYCQNFAVDTLPAIHREFVERGEVRVAFRHLPLESIHPSAFETAVVAHCAGRGGKFWEAHDTLFRLRLRGRLDESARAKVGAVLGLEASAFEGCVAGAGAAERVREDMKIAADLGINGTPIFFLGVADNKDSMRVKEVLQGAEPIENFRAAIGRVLANLSGS